ncbi:MAG TPA: hypothetical protein VFV23_01565 [Verrucomicrobiae bacterium]|nr:hypothetical protein [Verrucomicrobiae bacterium]
MKRKNVYRLPVLLIAALWLPVAGRSAEKPATAPNVSPTPKIPERSVFIMPVNPLQGRDPFFPNSTRPYEEASAGKKTEDVSMLEIKGFVGTGSSKMVIINNHTFASGDEGDVSTSQGRVHVHCIEIKDNRVIIEVDGQRHELTFRDNL